MSENISSLLSSMFEENMLASLQGFLVNARSAKIKE